MSYFNKTVQNSASVWNILLILCTLSCHNGSVQGSLLVQSERGNTNLLEGINCGIALLLNVILWTYENILDDKIYVIRFYQLKLNNIWGHFQVAMLRWLLASKQQLAAAIAAISSSNNYRCLVGCSNRPSYNLNGCVFAAQVDQLFISWCIWHWWLHVPTGTY